MQMLRRRCNHKIFLKISDFARESGGSQPILVIEEERMRPLKDGARPYDRGNSAAGRRHPMTVPAPRT